MYTYVHNNPLIYADPTGNYCVSADGNWTREGDCSSSESVYLGDDSAYQGSPIIQNGMVISNVGGETLAKPYRSNYWSTHYEEMRISRDHSPYVLDLYGNVSSIPVYDDPFFYVVDGAGLVKAAYGSIISAARAAGKLILVEAAEAGTKYISKEVSELGANKINHILADKHDWGKIVDNPKNWGEVSAVMSKVLRDGAESPYGKNKKAFIKVLKIGNEHATVTYIKLPGGKIKVSDGWVVYPE